LSDGILGCQHMAHNVRRLCDGAAIAILPLSFALKIYRITEDEHMTSGSTIAKPLVARCALYPGSKKWQVSTAPQQRSIETIEK